MDASDGIYKKQKSGVWGNEDGSKVLVFKDSGWDGCTAVNYVPNANCKAGHGKFSQDMAGHRWGYIPDLMYAIHSNVNIWRKTGSSSGITTQCEGTVNIETTSNSNNVL